MTHEEKLAWARAASDEELLNEFANMDRCSQIDRIFEHAERWGISPEEILGDRAILRDEVLRRMSAKA